MTCSSNRRATLLRAAIGSKGPAQPTVESWDVWVDTARVERVIPLLYEAVIGDSAHLPDGYLHHAEQMQLDVAALSVRLEHRLLELGEVLDSAGIDFAVLKGIATAHLDYPDPANRQFGDVDLLVDPSDFIEARAALARHGWHQAYGLPRHHARFTHAVTLKSSGGMTELDLHQHIGRRSLGLLLPTRELLAARVPFDIASRRLWALSDADRLIHASVHAIASRGGYRRLSSVADVMVLSSHLSDHANAVLRRAEGWRVRSLVEAAIRQAWLAAMIDLPDAWASAMTAPVSRRDWWIDRAYLNAKRRPVAEELAYLWHMDRWGERLLYLYGHLRMESGPKAVGLGSRLRYLGSRLKQRE